MSALRGSTSSAGTRQTGARAAATPVPGADRTRAADRVGLLVQRMVGACHTNVAMVVVVTAYVVAAIIVPTLAPVAIWDDWVYVRAAEDLSQDGRLAVPPPSAANVVLQAAWGALFQVVLGPSPGVLRLSTVVLVLIGGLAVYGTCRRLGCDAELSALAAAIYLFNPLSFILSYSFMTDAPYMALVAVAAYWFVRASTDRRQRDLVCGSAAVSAAYLVRPQALALLASVLAALLVHEFRRGGRRDPRRAAQDVLATVALPAVTVIAFGLWATISGDGPASQSAMSKIVSDAGVAGTWLVFRETLFDSVAYVGFFLTPLLALLAARLGLAPRAMVVLVGGGIVGLLALDVALRPGLYMPYAPSWLEQAGLGPAETAGRGAFFSPVAVRLVTALAFATVSLFCVHLGRYLSRPGQNQAAAVLLWLLLGQFCVVTLPAFTFGAPFDRYLLPLLPLSVCLAAWMLRGPAEKVQVALVVGWTLTFVAGAVSVVETRNFLTVQEAKWQLAQELLDTGVPRTSVSAGPSWDGYTTYEKSQESLPQPPIDALGRWWIGLWGRTIRSTHLVWGEPVAHHQVSRTVTVDQWWRPDAVLYVNVRVGP